MRSIDETTTPSPRVPLAVPSVSSGNATESLAPAPWHPETSPPPSGDDAPHRPWVSCWPEIRARLANRPRLLLALGFDGVLSPTVPRPADAMLPQNTRSMLLRLADSPRVTLAFLSGRSIGDICSRVGVANAFYIGNHGMEIHGPAFSSSDGLAVNCRSDLVDALAFLTRYGKRLRGVMIEDKGLTVNVHWRSASEEDVKALHNLMEVIVRNHPRLRIFAGAACWELRARASWNKGDALRQILSHLRLTPADTIYVGAEHTDEDAFIKLSEGFSFCVGTVASSAARFRLNDAGDASRLLSHLFGEITGFPIN